jgi:hypothetical protein
MILIALDFWSIVVYAFVASVFFIGYRLTWRLAYLSEGLIISLARGGMPGLARGLLFALIGYNEQTYQQSRFIVWNQVHVRFFVLWGASFLLTGLIFLFQIRPVVWVPLALGFVIYRLVRLWMNPPRPPIHTQDPALKQLIQDVNEPSRPTRYPARPMIRRWDYLDELFAESV